MNAKEIAEELRERRKKEGLSLRQLAAVTDISASTLSRIENNKGYALEFDNLAKLHTWLNSPMLSISEKPYAGDYVVCDGNTLPNIKRAIFRDKKLSAVGKQNLWEVMEAMVGAGHRISVRELVKES